MLTKQFSKIVRVWLLACSIVIFSGSIAESKEVKETPSQIAKNNKGGGVGITRTSKILSLDKGTEQKETPKSVSKLKTSRETLGSNRHILAVPEKFPKDGVYIWCDPDGLWTMFWKAKQNLAIEVTITTIKPVIIKNTVRSKTKKLETQPNSLEISSDPNSHIGIAQFASVDDSIQFNILINGKSEPNSIFVGSLLNNPTQFPLKLNTRQLSHKVVTDNNAIKIEEFQEIVAIDKSVGMQSNKIIIAAGGSGSSGRNKAEKTKK
ncbi:hypothetical protein KAR91_75510 [Candidatus Pacearchaeota archaeon]|nr:hypothetical protein [Candidatus Pacearchaeota archaeon]